jgi:hypothetical protein
MVQEHTDLDTLDQLMRRLSFIVYHWKEGDEYKQFEIPASEYRGYDALVARATAPPVEWVELPDDTPLPPQFTQRTGAQQGLTHDGELLPC